MKIAIVNRSTLLHDSDLPPVVAAIQRQVAEHLAPGWNITAEIVIGEQPVAWIVQLVDDCPEADDIGYHDDDGAPAALVGVRSAIAEKTSWSSVLSHEVLELIVDPEAVRCFRVGQQIYDLEICDPVEGAPYLLDGVEVENFVLPSWFLPGSAGPWDHAGVLTGPLQLAAGGYASTADAGVPKQLTGRRARTSKHVAAPGSRRARRIHHSQQRLEELLCRRRKPTKETTMPTQKSLDKLTSRIGDLKPKAATCLSDLAASQTAADTRGQAQVDQAISDVTALSDAFDAAHAATLPPALPADPAAPATPATPAATP